MYSEAECERDEDVSDLGGDVAERQVADDHLLPVPETDVPARRHCRPRQLQTNTGSINGSPEI